MLDNFTKDVFASHLNTTFTTQSENGQSVPLELAEVAEGALHNPTGGYENFSLFFQGPLEAPLAQQTHELQHDTLGPVAIFLVPIRREASGIVYEAVFNRVDLP